MTRTLTTYDVTWFLDAYSRGQLDLDPPYQRRGVWTAKDRRFFIDTILNNYPAPPIFLHKTMDENGRATYHVVDGKQRLQTIIEFNNGNIRIPDDFVTSSLQKKRWPDLDRDTRNKFWNYVLIVEILPDVKEAQIRNTFDRINRNSRKLTPQEMRHAKYDGWFISFVEAEADKPEWSDFGVVTPGRSRRMGDIQFISELFGVVIKSEIVGFDHNYIDSIYAEYEDISEMELFDEAQFKNDIEKNKEIIEKLLLKVGEARDFLKVQGNMFSLWSYISLCANDEFVLEDFCDKYRQFIIHVKAITNNRKENSDIIYKDSVQEYASNLRGATTDLAPRNKRHSALVHVLQSSEVV
jgi:hypothetical protein